MKSCFGLLALACLSFILPRAVQAAKYSTKKAASTDLKSLRGDASEASPAMRSRRKSWCPGNRFPQVDIIVEGKGRYDDIVNASLLQSVLASDPEWLLGAPWQLSMTASSEEKVNLSFGFAGGKGSSSDENAYLGFVVPAGAHDKEISIIGSVKSNGSRTWLEYRGKDVITRPGAVKLTRICLVPAKCDLYFKTHPTMCTDGMWKRLSDPESRTGHNRSLCCEELTCEASAPCAPATKWTKRPSYNFAKGSTTGQCCIPKLCSASVCNSSVWKLKQGQQFGSTEQECCEPSDCETYQCSSLTKWSKKSSPGIGSTDEECCLARKCSDFVCLTLSGWGAKENSTEDAKDRLGSTVQECCDPLFCENHTCAPSTQWAPNPAYVNKSGGSNQACCSPKFCRYHKCKHTELMVFATTGDKSLLGSTDEECCETKLCKDYVCSDKTRWERRPDQTPEGIDRKGWSDEECCEPLLCTASDCLPETMWKKKDDLQLVGLLGSLSYQCCDPVLCDDYNCSGDYPDLNISSTKWIKKVDTNHYRFPGSTDEECCHPKYCSQFFTEFPSKYIRLPENLTSLRQGTTEAECYQELKCSDYCCVGAGKKLKVLAAKYLGSTDAECCEGEELVEEPGAAKKPGSKEAKKPGSKEAEKPGKFEDIAR